MQENSISENAKQPLLQLDYKLDRKNAAEAMIKRHFETNRTKNIIQALILAVLTVVFIVSVIIDYDGMSVLLIVVCLLGLVGIFYMPRSQARSMAAKFENGVDFKLELFESSVAVTANRDNKSEIPFENLRWVQENDSYYYFEAEKRLFPVPKSFFTEEQIVFTSKFLSQKLENRYKDYRSKQKQIN